MGGREKDSVVNGKNGREYRQKAGRVVGERD